MLKSFKIGGKVTVITAACMLKLFIDHRIELDEDAYDELCDIIYDLLEKVRDERYRIIKVVT